MQCICIIGYEPSKKKGRKKWPWEPLLEDNGKGFYVRQQHVVPHIGPYATPRVLSREEINSRAKKVPNPKYKYYKEIEEVMERLRNLNDYQKAAIEWAGAFLS